MALSVLLEVGTITTGCVVIWDLAMHAYFLFCHISSGPKDIRIYNLKLEQFSGISSLCWPRTAHSYFMPLVSTCPLLNLSLFLKYFHAVVLILFVQNPFVFQPYARDFHVFVIHYPFS